MSDNGLNVKDQYKGNTVEELQSIQRSLTLPFAICALNISGDLNIGIMMRTACLLGAERFFIYGKRHYDRRSSVGSQNYIPTITITPSKSEDSFEYAEEFRDHLWGTFGYYPTLIETEGDDIRDINEYLGIYSKMGMKTCLVFGSESNGLPKILKSCFKTFTIPQRSVMRNLNVSSAMAIATWEFTKSFK